MRLPMREVLFSKPLGFQDSKSHYAILHCLSREHIRYEWAPLRAFFHPASSLCKTKGPKDRASKTRLP